jgi:outer membrane protein TolC
MIPSAIALPALSFLFAATGLDPALGERLAAETNVSGGLTANEAARRAEATSGDVEARHADVESADAAVAQSDVAFFPRLAARASYSRLSAIDPPILGVIVGANAPVGPLPAGTPLANVPVSIPVLLNQTTFQASLTVPVSDYLLRVAPQHGAAARAEDAALSTEEASRRTVRADAKILYYEWARARLSRLVQDDAVAQAEGHLDDVSKAFEVGATSRADVLRVEAQLATAEQAAARAAAVASALETRLRTAMHVGANAPLAIGEALETDFASALETHDVDRLATEAERGRPELRAIDATIASLGQQASATSRLAIPTVAVVSEVTDADPNPRYIPAPDRFEATWSVTAQLLWSPNDAMNAYEGGRALDAKQAQARAQRRALLDGVRADLASALQAVDVANSAQRTTARAVASAEESYRVRRSLFQNAHATSVELTDAETELTRARLDLVSARIDARVAEVELQHATGREGQGER